jgi:hypothetical protein
MAANRKRTSIPSELKEELKIRITVMKLEGECNHSIANDLGLSWTTVDKYWDEILEQAGVQIDAVKLIRERRMVTERLVGKSVRDFYAARSGIREVAIAMELADKYNGVTASLAIEPTEKLPALLSIEVMNVEVEMPPIERQTEQVLDTVEY